MTQTGATLLLTLLCMLSLGAKPAAACELVCGRFLPGQVRRVPSNAPALVFLHSDPEPGPVRLTRIDGDRNEPVSLRLEPMQATFEHAMNISLIRVDALVEGGRYRLDHPEDNPLKCHAASSSFDVGPEAPLPTGLGDLVATPSHSEVLSFICAGKHVWGARSEQSLTIAESVLPWRGLLLYRSVIDKNPAEFKSDLGFNPPESEVHTPCGEDGSGTAAEPYEVYLEGMIPGLTETWKSSAVSFVLQCEKRPIENAPAQDALAAGTGGSAALAARSQPAAAGCNAVEQRWPGAWTLSLCALVLARVCKRKRAK